MTHRASFTVLLTVLAALVLAPVAASGVTTYHGQFTSAEGWLYTSPPPDMTAVVHLGDLFLKGPWNIAVGDDAVVGDVVQVTGEPIFQSTSAQHCGYPYGPCGQWFPLGWSLGGRLADWTIAGRTASELSLTKVFPLPDGTVFFTYQLVLNTATGDLTITMPIEGRKCPYGWKEIVFYGESHN